MKRKKAGKGMALILAAAMTAGLLGGCGSSAKTSAVDNTAVQDKETAAAEAESGEIQKVRYVTPGNEWSDQAYVLEQVNKKLLEDGMNLEVELIRIPWDAWDQKTNLMLSTGEEFELSHVMQDLKSASVLRSQNAIIPINEYVDKYPHLKEVMGDFWSDFTVEGEILAVPAASTNNISKDYGRVYYQQEVFDRAGCTIPQTIDELLDDAVKMQKMIKEETGKNVYCWPHQLNSVPDWMHRTYDDTPFTVENTLGLVRIDQDGTVSSWYESEDFKKDCETYKKMYDMGLLHPDILTLDHEFQASEGENGRFLFGFDTYTYPAMEMSLKKNTGNTLSDFVLNEELGNYRFFSIFNGNAVPSSCKNPEAGIKFLDWLYSNEENYRLFTYGIEGRNYNIVGDRIAEFVKGPDGNNTWHYDEWQMGLIDYKLFEEGISEKCLEVETQPMSGKITVSPIIGFTFDQTPVANEIANLQTEVIASIYPIKFGLVDYDSHIDDAIANLKAAGMDKVIDEYRRQFEEFRGQ